MNDLKFTTAGEYMNNRVQDLIEQTNLKEIIDDAYLERGDWQSFVEQFARMIVSDCAGMVYNNCDDDEEGERISQMILKAYGIGEEE